MENPITHIKTKNLNDYQVNQIRNQERRRLLNGRCTLRGHRNWEMSANTTKQIDVQFPIRLTPLRWNQRIVHPPKLNMSVSALDALMSQSFDSPPRPVATPANSRKRLHSDDPSDKEDEEEDGFPTPANRAREGQTLFMTPAPLANANIITFARRYGLSKLLKQSQMQELLDFVKVRSYLLSISCTTFNNASVHSR